MSSEAEVRGGTRNPSVQRGKRRVAEPPARSRRCLPRGATSRDHDRDCGACGGAHRLAVRVFSLPRRRSADTLVQNYVALLAVDLESARGKRLRFDTRAPGRGSVQGCCAAHPQETCSRRCHWPRPAWTSGHAPRGLSATCCASDRRDLRARSPTLSAEGARERAVVVLQLMKAASSLIDEEGLGGRTTALRELQALAMHYLEQR